MQKYMAFFGAWLWVSTAMAGECVGGTWITANSMTNNPNGNCTEATCNGATFCKSNGTMNWWSAFTWCASNGLHLASFQEMCPGISTSSPTNCVNLKGVNNAVRLWSSLGNGEGNAFVISPSEGMVIRSASRSATNYHSSAVCK